MTLEEIALKDAEVKAMPQAPARWDAELQLFEEKVACPGYKHPSQQITFAEWMVALAEASKEYELDWTESQRQKYYEGQPLTWIPDYGWGASPSGAIQEDMVDWEW